MPFGPYPTCDCCEPGGCNIFRVNGRTYFLDEFLIRERQLTFFPTATYRLEFQCRIYIYTGTAFNDGVFAYAQSTTYAHGSPTFPTFGPIAFDTALIPTTKLANWANDGVDLSTAVLTLTPKDGADCRAPYKGVFSDEPRRIYYELSVGKMLVSGTLFGSAHLRELFPYTNLGGFNNETLYFSTCPYSQIFPDRRTTWNQSPPFSPLPLDFSFTLSGAVLAGTSTPSALNRTYTFPHLTLAARSFSGIPAAFNQLNYGQGSLAYEIYPSDDLTDAAPAKTPYAEMLITTTVKDYGGVPKLVGALVAVALQPSTLLPTIVRFVRRYDFSPSPVDYTDRAVQRAAVNSSYFPSLWFPTEFTKSVTELYSANAITGWGQQDGAGNTTAPSSFDGGSIVDFTNANWGSPTWTA